MADRTDDNCWPSCGQAIVLRISKRRAKADNQFLGCNTYPTCKGTSNFIST